MRVLLPSSLGSFRVRFFIFDAFWAAVSPLLALCFRDAYILSFNGASTTALYCAISLVFSLIAFSAFRISDGMSRFFSVQDALNVVKAVVAAGVMTSVVLFTFTRLDGIPRATPVLHVLILAAGLVIARTIALLRDSEDKPKSRPNRSAIDHIIMIGSTRLSSLYIKFLRAYNHHRIVAVLDPDPELIGRVIHGTPIIAIPQNLERVIEEFAVHGIRTNRIIIGGDEDLLSEAALAQIREVCHQREIGLDFVPELIGLNKLQAPKTDVVSKLAEHQVPTVAVSRYFQFKRLVDFFAALAAIILLAPLLMMTCVLILLDVGSPVLFWQHRIGQNGCNFLLYKFRTLRPPFDWQGQPVPEDQRLSWIGRFVRAVRLDEVPQLFNVLVGDMSLIGPRPLLLRDQPTNPTVRLSVRPGITGWAQVNGGNLVTVAEKTALDEWYVRHASPWLDLRIITLTFRFLSIGERRSEDAVAAAHAIREGTYSRVEVRQPGSTHAQNAALGINAIARSSAARRPRRAVRPHQ